MGRRAVLLAAAACAAALVAVALVARARAPGWKAGPPAATGARGRFFTGSATEEPTRSYVPYTGTVPVGLWGAAPWAVAAQGPESCPGPVTRAALTFWGTAL